jgi:hypothetical protein
VPECCTRHYLLGYRDAGPCRGRSV